jgi:hypothetical protein
MWPRMATLALTAIGFGAFLTACDSYAVYTVINQTDEELITWPFFEDCGGRVDDNMDVLSGEVVQPHTQHDYSAWLAGGPPECVHVANLDRRIVLAEEYHHGATYVVKPPLQPSGDPVPKQDDLPNQSLGDSLRSWVEGPPLVVAFNMLLVLFGLGVLAAFAITIFIIVRFFWRHYARKT